MKRNVWVVGLVIGILLVILQWSKYSFYRGPSSFDWWWTAVLLFALVVGLYLGNKNKAARAPSKEPDAPTIEKLGITPQALEILSAIQAGRSNAEIANQLYVSEATIKSHVSNLLVKLDAKRRTQAVALAIKWSVLIEK